MTYATFRLQLGAFLLPALLFIACGGSVDEGTKGALVKQGYDEKSAAELSKLKLSEAEVTELGTARATGLDGTSAVEIVKAVRDKDLQFDIGDEVMLLHGIGMSTSAIVELAEMGAIPRWEGDIRVMKIEGIGESTILNIARRRFVDGKDDLLSGGEYAQLKRVGMSDVGIETFVEKGGNAKQLQDAQLKMAMGESEQAALKSVGM